MHDSPMFGLTNTEIDIMNYCAGIQKDVYVLKDKLSFEGIKVPCEVDTISCAASLIEERIEIEQRQRKDWVSHQQRQEEAYEFDLRCESEKFYGEHG